MKRRAPAKKTVQKPAEEAPKEQPPVITQVVEVIEIDTAPSTLTEAPVEDAVTAEAAPDQASSKEASDMEPASVDVLEEVEIIEETRVPDKEPEERASLKEEEKVSEPPPPVTEEKQKQVVEELFSRKPEPQLTEISINRTKKKGNPLGLWAALVITAAVTTGIGLLILSRSGGGMPSLGQAPTPTPTAVPVPTETPAVTLTRSDISIQVLNGGGVPGAASTMKDFLVEKGYTVADVGNASSYDYTDTEIVVKPGGEAVLELLTDDLKAEYALGSSSADLPEDVSYDARVIVGAE